MYVRLKTISHVSSPINMTSALLVSLQLEVHTLKPLALKGIGMAMKNYARREPLPANIVRSIYYRVFVPDVFCPVQILPSILPAIGTSGYFAE